MNTADILTSPHGWRCGAFTDAEVCIWFALPAACFFPPKILLFTFSNISLKLLAVRAVLCGISLDAREEPAAFELCGVPEGDIAPASFVAALTDRAKLTTIVAPNMMKGFCLHRRDDTGVN